MDGATIASGRMNKSESNVENNHSSTLKRFILDSLYFKATCNLVKIPRARTKTVRCILSYVPRYSILDVGSQWPSSAQCVGLMPSLTGFNWFQLFAHGYITPFLSGGGGQLQRVNKIWQVKRTPDMYIACLI